MKKYIIFLIPILFLNNKTFSQLETTRFYYDNLNRVTKIEYYNGDTEEYTYDAIGNRITLLYTPVDRLTYVPDDNFEQALIDLGYDDVLDDYVLTSNISSIETLNLDNKNISDLTGIEDFSALWGLVCSNNNLSQINISENANLTELYCSDNNLTNIDISNNLLLEKINCNDNFLNSLDISNNHNLYFLAITNNNFDNFNFGDYPSLTKIYVKDNNFTSIDLSNNLNLEALSCSNNNLSYLNLKNGNNELLTALWATNNPNLTCIQVDNEDSANSGLGVYENWIVDENINYSENCQVGIDDEFLVQYISIFPNPSYDKIKVIYPDFIKINKIEIYNLTGQIIYYTEKILNIIDISKFSNGVYFLEITDKKNRVAKFKIIKK